MDDVDDVCADVCADVCVQLASESEDWVGKSVVRGVVTLMGGVIQVGC